MSPFRRLASAAGLLCVCVLGLWTPLIMGGCTQPLLTERDERTPFDRYDVIRNQYGRQWVENEFGGREPNLRGRLGRK